MSFVIEWSDYFGFGFTTHSRKPLTNAEHIASDSLGDSLLVFVDAAGGGWGVRGGVFLMSIT